MRQSRLAKSLDAASQWVNVTFLRRARDTHADESTSGRCHWEARHGSRHWTWRVAERMINAVFWWDRGPEGEGHCEMADRRDYLRALYKVRRYGGRING